MTGRGTETSCVNVGKPTSWSFGNFVNLSGMNEFVFAVTDWLLLSFFHSFMHERRSVTSEAGVPRTELLFLKVSGSACIHL